MTNALGSVLPTRQTADAQTPSPLLSPINHGAYGMGPQLSGERRVVPVIQGSLIFPPTIGSSCGESWPPSSRQTQIFSEAAATPLPPQPLKAPWSQGISVLDNRRALISIRDKDFLRRYYERVFQNLQQTNCRVLAKAYIKLVEPRKQVNHPYNGRKVVAGRPQQLDPDDTKPPWWPSGVSHREPDHLPKAGKQQISPYL